MAKYNEEQLWKLFSKLPDELKDTVLSEDTANNISGICQRYEIKDEKISKIAELVGNSLMGLLPPDELQSSLEKEVDLDPEIAKKVSQEINRFIFYPVKESLLSFYKIEFTPGGKIIKLSPEEKEKKRVESAGKKPSAKDVYRELIA